MKFASRIKAVGDCSGIVKKEAVDLVDDVRLARRLKRKQISFEKSEVNSCSKKASNKTRNKNDEGNQALVEVVTADSDYENYYNNMAQSVDFDIDDLCMDIDEDDDNAADVLDPHYMMFLNNLREDGKSYVLELALSNETSVVLKYEEELYDVSCAANGCSSKRVSFEGTRQYNGKMNSVSIDESYKEFLEILSKEGQLMLFAPEDGEIVHDKDEESTSDSEVIILDNNLLLHGNSLPFVSSKLFVPCIDLDGEVCIKSPIGSKESPFRKTLMEKLHKPFDNGELQDLWQRASYRRPPYRDIELRGRTVAFAIHSKDSNGKSYIDMHQSLAERIDASQHDPQKILNLLRGFFYWLENGPQADAFPPWEDPECLRTLPPF